MASSLSWLHSCKASQLKAIAHLTGLNCTGTKPLVTSRLLQHLPHSFLSGPDPQSPMQTQTQPTTIVSIDMGIRNLAYCRLTLPPASARSSAPLLTDWTRVAISRQSAAMELTAEKESFDPATYSKHAYALIAALLFPATPSHILIERQRFRSMGGSAVQEWTLRVNMFEAMLYAVLATLAARGIWKGAVHAVSPAKVAGFWVGEREEDGPGETRKGGKRRNKEISALDDHNEVDTPPNRLKIPTKSQKTKSQKIELVSHWLSQTPKIIQLQPKSLAADTAHAYLSKMEGGRSGGERKRRPTTTAPSPPITSESTAKTSSPPPLGKLDDLADCLLQGMAWIQWERNRARIVERGLSGLEESGGGEVGREGVRGRLLGEDKVEGGEWEMRS